MDRPTTMLLSGQIGAGKTTVGRCFSGCGAEVVSADAISHELLNTNSTLISEIADAFGDDVVRSGKIDRKRLGSLVFADDRELALLESIELPYIKDALLKVWHRSSAKLLVLEIPLLHKVSELIPKADYVCVVVADKALAKERVRTREGTLDTFSARLAHQSELSWLLDRADIIIKNNGSLDVLQSRVREIYNNIAKEMNWC